MLPVGIVLTRTRFSVEKLVECIKVNPQFEGRIFPEPLLGQAAMTDVTQKRTLDNFRLGECLRYFCFSVKFIQNHAPCGCLKLILRVLTVRILQVKPVQRVLDVRLMNAGRGSTS